MMEDNVHSQIDDYLDTVFAPHEDIAAVADLRIEVRRDLFDRIEDALSAGVSDAAAYDQAVASLGDIRTTIDDLVAAAPAGADQAAPSTVESPVAEPGSPGTGATPDSMTPPTDSTSAESDNVWTNPDHQVDSGVSDFDNTATDSADTASGWEPFAGAWSWWGDEANRADWEQAWRQRGDALREQVQGLVDGVMRQVDGAMSQVDDALRQANFGRDRQRYRQAQPTPGAAGRGGRQNYVGSNLRGLSYAGMDVAGWNFTSCSMRDVDFERANLAGATIQSSDLRNVNFDQADLTGASLKMSSMRGTSFSATRMKGANLSYADLRQVHFSGADLSGARLSFADLRGAVFADCLMVDTDFRYSDLRDVCYDGLALSGLTFDNASLAGTSFAGSTLTNVSFRRLSRRSLTEIVFRDTSMDRRTYNSLASNGVFDTAGIQVRD